MHVTGKTALFSGFSREYPLPDLPAVRLLLGLIRILIRGCLYMFLLKDSAGNRGFKRFFRNSFRSFNSLCGVGVRTELRMLGGHGGFLLGVEAVHTTVHTHHGEDHDDRNNEDDQRNRTADKNTVVPVITHGG